MDATEHVRLFSEFLSKHYYSEILEQVRKGEKFLAIDFRELLKFNVELADDLLEQPEQSLKAAQIALEQYEEQAKGIVLRFKNIPTTSKVQIRDVRSKHLNKLISAEGIVKQKSDVRPQVTAAAFECPSCGNRITVLQLDTKFKEPFRCTCGRKGKFLLLSKQLVDAQGIVLEEIPEQLDGGAQPKRINVFLQNDLVSPITERRTNPGSKMRVNGIIKEVPIISKSGVQSTRFDLLLEANSIEPIKEDYSDIIITDEQKKEITELSKDENLNERLVKSIAPNIYGHDEIKEALILQLLGGVKKVADYGPSTRGDIHILLVGDPGAGKSQLLKRISKVAPKARFISGKGVSGAGLTASVVKDEFLGGWSLEAGALVLANKGVCCIDELDKMSKDDTAAMHEALEGQTITISKANVQATLRAETTVLAAANPKLGRFDTHDPVAPQIALPPTLINRFDLIFPIKDIPDKDKDEKTAEFILSLHQKTTKERGSTDIDTQLLRRYIAYARQNCNPVLTDGAVDEIQKYYLSMRASGSVGSVKSVPISARQLEALVRLSEAATKLRLSEKVQRKDAKTAIKLVDYCLKQVAFDEETGKIDIDKLTTGISASQRSKIVIVKEVIADLENKLGKTIPLEDVMMSAEERGVKRGECEEIIQKLKRMGDVFEPRREFISRI
ncbi:minichromosome maintenance protein MCM [Candidatus Woesearchaeota archaeon]|nr:minichromosome maintenance protein MCM [Candidatus Woesearchaeota archaeon]